MENFKGLIQYFNSVNVKVDDITTESEKEKFQKVVEVTYNFEGTIFKTKPLYYKRITNAPNVKNARIIEEFFKKSVYWLDIDIHQWPQSSGETDIDDLIINDITDDHIFKKELLKLANNKGTGYIQLITQKGRSNQYYRNFENNNHWHDIVLLIKSIIENKPDFNSYLMPLVFRWDGNKHTERLRVSLSPHFGARAILYHLIKNVNSKKSTVLKELIMQEYVELLQYKKQIILQGPPGTGKTRLAKELAESILKPDKYSIDEVRSLLQPGMTFRIGVRNEEFKISKVSEDYVFYYRLSDSSKFNDQLDLITNAVNRLLKNGKENLDSSGNYKDHIARYIYDLYNLSEQLQIVQFHPSYAYEDFVRGITAMPDEKGLNYKAQNKVLAEFAKKALDNYRLSKEDNSEAKIDKWVEETFEEYKYDIEQRVEEKIIPLSGSIGIFNVQHDCFRYGIDWQFPSRINFTDFKILIKAVVDGRHNVKNVISKELSVHAHYRNTYYSNLLSDFFAKYKFEIASEYVKEKNYVFIIDEINRANLSTVLGELIYALEYRGEAVDTLYSVDGSSKFILPQNLYIIGTMNTADRSVSEIDYAIRRRFAFVDVLPNDLSSELGEDFDSTLFQQVQRLFISSDNIKSEYLTGEFEPSQVQLGHSYFIKKDKEGGSMDIRWKYEIKPILREYVKDGILKVTALEEIDKIEKERNY